jgi:hypothetical protein
MTTEELSQLQPGQWVIVKHVMVNREGRAKVERITKTQIIAVPAHAPMDRDRYGRADGIDLARHYGRWSPRDSIQRVATPQEPDEAEQWASEARAIEVERERRVALIAGAKAKAPWVGMEYYGGDFPEYRITKLTEAQFLAIIYLTNQTVPGTIEVWNGPQNQPLFKRPSSTSPAPTTAGSI